MRMKICQTNNEKTVLSKEVMLYQVRQCTEEIFNIDRTFLSTQPLFFSALFIGVTFCLSVKIDSLEFQISLWASLFFPSVYFWFFYNIIKYTLRQLKLGGYRKYLENEINQKLDKPVLIWESHLTNELHDVSVGAVAQFVFAFPLGIGLFALAGYNLHVRGEFPMWTKLCFWSVSVAQILVLLFMLFMLITAREKICDLCVNYCEIPEAVPHEETETNL